MLNKSKHLKNLSFWQVQRRHKSLHKASFLVSFTSTLFRKHSQNFYRNINLAKVLISFFFAIYLNFSDTGEIFIKSFETTKRSMKKISVNFY